VLGPFLTALPMPAIAGVLALVGVGMIEAGHVRHLMRNRIDGAVFLLTFLSVTFLGLDIGILVAVLASAGFLLAGMSKVGFVVSVDGDVEHIAVSGNLFYASLDRLSRHLHGDPTTRTVLDLSRVPYCDATAHAMIQAVQRQRHASGGRLDLVPAGSR